MMMEKEREVVVREAKQQAAEQVDQEVKRRLKNSINSKNLRIRNESRKRKQNRYWKTVPVKRP